MKYQIIAALAGALALGAAGVAGAQAAGPAHPTAAQMRAEARITKAAAQKTALARVPAGSTIEEGELEHENGRTVYSFDIKVPGRSGIQEIQVSAVTGAVVSVTHESPAAEAGEAAADHGKKHGEKGEKGEKPGGGR